MIAAMLLQMADARALPADWSALAPVPYARAPAIRPTLARFVAQEIAAGRRAEPHAIACPMVEQFAAGLVLGFARGNLAPPPAAPDLRYRTTIPFAWRG